jgi:hypothetical protein
VVYSTHLTEKVISLTTDGERVDLTPEECYAGFVRVTVSSAIVITIAEGRPRPWEDILANAYLHICSDPLPSGVRVLWEAT